MKEPVTLPRNPSEETKRLNPSLYAKGKAKAPKEARPPSPFEEKFLALYTAVATARGTDDILQPEREYIFSPPRKWRFDFAWPHVRTFLELEGGTFSGGRHTRGSGFARDCDKYNSATLQGWVGFRIPTGGLSAELVEQVHDFIRTRTGAGQRPD